MRKLVRVLGAGGGYILGPSHVIQAGTPPENIIAMFEEFSPPRLTICVHSYPDSVLVSPEENSEIFAGALSAGLILSLPPFRLFIVADTTPSVPI